MGVPSYAPITGCVALSRPLPSLDAYLYTKTEQARMTSEVPLDPDTLGCH